MNKNPNAGHGWVFPRPDGIVAKCGGPDICPDCHMDKYGVPKPAADYSVVQTVVTSKEESDALRTKAACFDWLVSGKKLRQGIPMPNVGVRIIDHGEDKAMMTFMYWTSQEKLTEAILAEIEKEKQASQAKA